ncbi:hypothetical protein KBD18_01055 [Patescibacteria group bacterium]|nr:hypothetical protein [Patescibacteria group bacterium]
MASNQFIKPEEVRSFVEQQSGYLDSKRRSELTELLQDVRGDDGNGIRKDEMVEKVLRGLRTLRFAENDYQKLKDRLMTKYTS